MNQENQEYIKLQKHLDKQAVGFPATPSGAELKILKHVFTPYEAEVALCLTYKFEPLTKLSTRISHLNLKLEDLEKHLDSIHKKGGIEMHVKDGEKVYCCAPLVVGIYEMQLDRLSPEFLKDYKHYTRDPRFGLEFLSTKVPQMRTVPLDISIKPEYQISSYDEINTLLEKAESPFVIVECICRKKKTLEGKSCKVTQRKETCMAVGHMAQSVLLAGSGREISKEEAYSIIAENQKEGLVLQPSNTQKADFICSCCGCCCGMLGIYKSLPKPHDFWATNFHSEVNIDLCTSCGLCVDACQVDAMHIPGKKQAVIIDENRCIGCGVCVPVCKQNALMLIKNKKEIRPPLDRDVLYDTIMKHRKGKIRKLILTGKLVYDVMFTGKTDLIKRKRTKISKIKK